SVQVIMQVRIDALDITVLKGGGAEVGQWATEHGFRLPPAAPEVLDFYANRSPIFLAAVFDADAAKARGQQIGDGTPVHVTIPTANPWVPLRILGLGKNADDRIDADVYLLTDQRPALLPYPFANGMRLDHSATATTSLLTTFVRTRAWAGSRSPDGSRRSRSTHRRASSATTSPSTRRARVPRASRPAFKCPPASPARRVNPRATRSPSSGWLSPHSVRSSSCA